MVLTPSSAFSPNPAQEGCSQEASGGRDLTTVSLQGFQRQSWDVAIRIGSQFSFLL